MATLVYSDADGVDRQYALGHEPIMVGRAAECAIRSEDPRVSRMHARFFLDQGALWVEDLGSSNGIYVGPNKVQRAPVPTGEIVLIGSLMIRLLPASGTLPPPIGLHGTLAQWLEMERKARAGVEEERDAFAKRVGDMHQEMTGFRDAIAALTARSEKAERDLASAQIRVQGTERTISGATSRAAEAEEKRATADKLVAELRDKVAALEAKLVAAGEAAGVKQQAAAND